MYTICQLLINSHSPITSHYYFKFFNNMQLDQSSCFLDMFPPLFLQTYSVLIRSQEFQAYKTYLLYATESFNKIYIAPKQPLSLTKTRELCLKLNYHVYENQTEGKQIQTQI